jgi:hypothetical protein
MSIKSNMTNIYNDNNATDEVAATAANAADAMAGLNMNASSNTEEQVVPMSVDDPDVGEDDDESEDDEPGGGGGDGEEVNQVEGRGEIAQVEGKAEPLRVNDADEVERSEPTRKRLRRAVVPTSVDFEKLGGVVLVGTYDRAGSTAVLKDIEERSGVSMSAAARRNRVVRRSRRPLQIAQAKLALAGKKAMLTEYEQMSNNDQSYDLLQREQNRLRARATSEARAADAPKPARKRPFVELGAAPVVQRPTIPLPAMFTKLDTFVRRGDVDVAAVQGQMESIETMAGGKVAMSFKLRQHRLYHRANAPSQIAKLERDIAVWTADVEELASLASWDRKYESLYGQKKHDRAVDPLNQ